MSEAGAGGFVSVHIFYNAPDLRQLIVNCIVPLVSLLRRGALIERFFFIRYWEGGPHIRLRVLPACSRKVEVCDLISAKVGAFLDQNPSMFDLDPEQTTEVMRVLYEFEYGKQSFLDRYGPDGKIPMRENNTYAYIDYVPEFGRYGGPHGIAIAHDVFQSSSEIILEVLRDDNSRHWDRILGLAFQFMLHFAYSFYEDRDKLIALFAHFAARIGDLKLPDEMETELEFYFNRRAQRISRYVEQVQELNGKLRTAEGSALGQMVSLAYETRNCVELALSDERLVFDPPFSNGEDAMRNLVMNYMHMSNNRLGVRSFEELYIAKLIVRALKREE